MMDIDVMAASGPGAHTLSSAQKAAIIIAALGPDQAEGVLRSFDETNLRSFARAMGELRDVPKEALEGTITEFLQTLSNKVLPTGRREIEAILSKIMNADAVERVVTDALGAGESVWADLARCPDGDLVRFLENEHPQTAAVILSKMGSEHSARIMSRLSTEAGLEAVNRMATIGETPEEVMKVVTEGLRKNLLIKVAKTRGKRKPDEMVGAIMDSLGGERRDSLMTGLTEERPDFAVAVQKRMFTFEDIPRRIDPRQLPVLTQVIDMATLRTALAFAMQSGSEAPEHILSNLTKRMAEQMRDDIAEGGEIKQKDGEKAQADVIAAIRALAKSGELELLSADEDDE